MWTASFSITIKLPCPSWNYMALISCEWSTCEWSTRDYLQWKHRNQIIPQIIGHNIPSKPTLTNQNKLMSARSPSRPNCGPWLSGCLAGELLLQLFHIFCEPGQYHFRQGKLGNSHLEFRQFGRKLWGAQVQTKVWPGTMNKATEGYKIIALGILALRWSPHLSARTPSSVASFSATSCGPKRAK